MTSSFGPKGHCLIINLNKGCNMLLAQMTITDFFSGEEGWINHLTSIKPLDKLIKLISIPGADIKSIISFPGYECRLVTLTFSRFGNVSRLKRSKAWLCGQRIYCICF